MNLNGWRCHHWDEIHGSRAQFKGVVTSVFGFELKVALRCLSGDVK